MCFKHHLEPQEQAKKCKVYSHCKKGKESSESPLAMGMHTPNRVAKEK